MRRIEGFFLNFDAHDPAAPFFPGSTIRTDGNDRIFGDLGNDWLVGGTGRDWLFGGFGDDLHNVDDDHGTNGGANNQPDGPQTSYEDYAYGGAGRDVLIANTGGDRLIDWAGEFNSYLVPFSPFGMSTVSRMISPALQDFLHKLGFAAGADRTRAADTGADPTRNGEPFGELGLVNQRDSWWQEQTGAPEDPQAGNTNGKKDVLRFADFNNGSTQGFSADSGIWTINGGALFTSATSTNGDAVSIFHVGEQLPSYYELQATINAVKPTGGWKANSYIIFDYHSPTDFKFAGINVSLDKIQLGHRTAAGWQVDVQASNVRLRSDTYYDVLVAVNGLVVTVTVNNSQSFSYAYAPRMIDGIASNLNWGYVGFGSENARGRLDNVQVKVLERPFTLQTTETFDDGSADLFTSLTQGAWQVSAGRYGGTISAGQDPAMSLVDLGLPMGIEAGARTELTTTLATGAAAGFVFDLYSTTDFKFVLVDAAADRVVIGHRTHRGWTIDKSVGRIFESTTDYKLVISLAASTVSVTVNDQAVVGHAFNGVVVDGAFGTMVRGGSASFDAVTIKTSDSRFRDAAPELLVASSAATAAAPSGGTITDAQLAPIVSAAADRWSSALGGDVARALQGYVFAVGRLEGQALAQTVGRVIVIDADAADHGWFVDATPTDDREFPMRSGAGELRAQVSSLSYGRMDLLTAVMHEIGHALGLQHNDAATAPDVMTPTLGTGVRRVPVSSAVRLNLGAAAGPAQSGTDADGTEPASTSSAPDQEKMASAPAMISSTPTTTITSEPSRRPPGRSGP